MSSLSSRLFLALVSTALFCGVAVADPPPASSDVTAELQAIRAQMSQQQARLQAQEEEIRRLRTDGEQNWINQRRTEEIKALIHEVLADAETRASLLQDGVTAGINDEGKVFLQSSDGGFLMNISGFTQIRYIANFRDDAEGSLGTTDDEESGFQIRRATLQFGGHISSPKVTYFLQIAGNRDTGGVDLEVATVGYRFSDALAINAGRYKAGFLFEEEDVSATRQMAVEQSLVNTIFTVSYVEGVELLADPTDWLRLHASINDGARSGDAGGTGNDFQNDTSDFALTGRAELKLAGDWKQKADFAAWSGEDTALFAGGAFHYEVAETGDSQATSPGVDDFFIYSVDGQFKFNDFSAFAAFIGRHANVTDTADTDDFDDFGAVAQLAYMIIPDKLAPFVRYEWIGPDDDRDVNDMNLVTVGANYYFRKHAVKFTLDAVWALDELNNFAFTSTPSATPSATSRSGLGLLPDSPDSDNQVVVRVQMQVMF